jgi:hypothetical protein
MKTNLISSHSLLRMDCSRSNDIKNGKTPLDLADNDACRELLEHHNAALGSLNANPTGLVLATLAHCAGKEPSDVAIPSLRAYHFDPSFLWAPPIAREAVFAWARDAYTAQVATTVPPFLGLSDDCIGDVLDYLQSKTLRPGMMNIVAESSSPEAHAWVCAIITAAIAVSVAILLETVSECHLESTAAIIVY